jgi:hypothetical protein
MPYIQESDRAKLDDCINALIICIKATLRDKPFEVHELNNDDMLNVAGKINYIFSRVTASLMGKPSYAKVAIITGVLENIKQEFYRRVASPYEDAKIIENGDIKEYKNL